MNVQPTFGPWTNVYGTARTLLALGTLVTLTLNPASHLFMPLGRSLHGIVDRVFPAKYGFFMQFSPEDLEIARWIAVAILVVVASGWRPRFTGILHWWISVSWASSGVVIDGGDQVAAVLSTLLLPLTLTDGRTWHWQNARLPEVATHASEITRLIARSTLFVIRLQVAIIYFNAGVAKMFVTEWNNGTAMYYWLSHPLFGAPDWLRPVLMPIVQDPLAVTLFTWGVMLFEVTLAMALVIRREFWAPLLVLGLAFHAGIGVMHGLVSFGLAMSAALVIFLQPHDRPFTRIDLTSFARRAGAWLATRRTPVQDGGGAPEFSPRSV